MDMDQVVCSCANVTNGMVKDAIDAGAATLEEVEEATGAGTICEICVEDLKNLVEEFTS